MLLSEQYYQILTDPKGFESEYRKAKSLMSPAEPKVVKKVQPSPKKVNVKVPCKEWERVGSGTNLKSFALCNTIELIQDSYAHDEEVQNKIISNKKKSMRRVNSAAHKQSKVD